MKYQEIFERAMKLSDKEKLWLIEKIVESLEQEAADERNNERAGGD